MDFAPVRARLVADKAPAALIESFERSFQNYVSGYTGLVPEGGLEPLQAIPDYAECQKFVEAGRRALSHTFVLKLNGGLGTGMGLEQAKSLLPVKQGQSFLDVLIRQVRHIRGAFEVPLPLVLMNSYSTDADTRDILLKHHEIIRAQKDIPLSFCQHRIPKIQIDSHLPVRWPEDPEKEWCPPGHGDIYLSLVTTGLLKLLLDRGFRYVFVSNVDNLGAMLDLGILGYFTSHGLPFLMEVTDRTEADRKGGHLARKRGGGLLLREIAMCPHEELESFQDISRHRYFNTNNLWIDLTAVQRHFDKHGGFDLPMIINKKTVDPKLRWSPAVVQLETAMGSALALFDNAGALRVPRTRFAPVKTTDDLLVLWSDVYNLGDDGTMTMAAGRSTPPTVRLDPGHYRIIDDFEARFRHGAPSLLHCESLTIKGDFAFGRNVVCKGHVTLKNDTTSQTYIADGTHLL